MEVVQDKSELQNVPFCRPEVTEDAIEAVAAVLRSGWMTTGPQVSALEAALGKYVREQTRARSELLHRRPAPCPCRAGHRSRRRGHHHASNLLRDRQRHPSGWRRPHSCRCRPDVNIDPHSVARLITPRTRAIIPVHIAGLPCYMDAIWELAQRHNLRVIEDAAHAAGASYNGVRIGGGESDAVAFSFYATKNLSTGEGGAVVTPSEELYDRMRVLCLHGISRDAWNRYSEKGNWHYDVVECGFKYNMSDIMGAIGIHQLAQLDRMNSRRAEIASAFNLAFEELPQVETPPNHARCAHAWHLYILRLNLDRLTIDRARFFTEMRERGVNCSVHFIPIPLHPYYKAKLEMRDPCSFALAEYPRLLSLPLYSSMQDTDVSRVIDATREVALRFMKHTTVAA